MPLDLLTDILRRAAGHYPRFSRRFDEAQALGRWEEAVGAAIARHSRAVRIDDGVLHVEVDHPIWKSELHYRKQQILELLNRGAEKCEDKRPIQDILFVDPRGRRRD